MRPRVVVVYPCAEHGFEVLVSDLVMPGKVVATSRSLDDANAICVRLAWNQRIRALPFTEAS